MKRVIQGDLPETIRHRSWLPAPTAPALPSSRSRAIQRLDL